jgi:hypothetical protein
MLQKIAELGGKYEAAVYAAQCSNLKRMLPLCTDWEVFFSYIYILQMFSFINAKTLEKKPSRSILIFCVFDWQAFELVVKLNEENCLLW